MTGGAAALPAAAYLLASDEQGRWLLVRHRDRWQLPGGLVEWGESPRAAAERETLEEIRLPLKARDLVTVAWVDAGRRGCGGRLAFVFSARLDVPDVCLQATEINAWRLAAPAQAVGLLHPLIAERLIAAQLGNRYTEQRSARAREIVN
ncbi:NUDIX domain-containing protein [Sphaerisporangium sp. NPDC004334]